MMAYKKLGLTAVTFFTCIAMTAQNNLPTAALDSAISEFLKSERILTKDTHWNPAHEQWHFKYTVEGDTLLIPREIIRLDSAFSQSATRSTYAYLCDQGKGPDEPWVLQFHKKDKYYSAIYGPFKVSNERNIRIVALDDSSRQIYYGLEWQVVPFADRYGKPWRTLEGVIFAFKQGVWTLKADYSAPRKVNPRTQTGLLTLDDLFKYDRLMAQLERLNEQSEGNNALPVSLRIYLISKLCMDFDGQLSQQQFRDISQAIPSFPEGMLNSEQKRILSQAVTHLGQCTQTMASGIFRRSAITDIGPFANPDYNRMIELEYDLGTYDFNLVSAKLDGTASKMATVSSWFPQILVHEEPAQYGRFFVRDMYKNNQLLNIKDVENHSLMLFADSLYTKFDLNDMTVKRGSDLNKRFAEVQRQLKALEKDLRKYSFHDADGDFTVMDEDGYGRLLAEAHNLQMRLLDENTDNLIPVWLLAVNYASMSYDELSRYMKRNRPYADHISLQPVWKYYEGLGKRQPGRRFTDAACVDTAGIAHRLSEYIGQGDYVVLQFWEVKDAIAHNGLKSMKAMSHHHSGKNIRFIGFSLNGKKKDWKNYIKRRGLHYVHLTAPGNGTEREWLCEAAQAYGIMTMPETIVFDPKGRIISSGLAADDLVNFVDSLPLKNK